MGHGITITCSSCGSAESFTLGVGMMYASLENVIFLVAPAARKKVLKVLAEHEVEEVDYEHALYACARCNTLHNRFHYQIVYDSGQVLEPRFRCGDCRGKLEPAEKDISQYSCRQCGSGSLKEEHQMLWD